MKKFGIFFVLAGAVIMAIGAAALLSTAIALPGGATVAAGIAVTMIGVVTLLAVHSSKVSFIPEV